MKKIFNIVVAVITCFCILTATTVTAFADTNTGVDIEGYTFHRNDIGNVYYDYPIEMHNVVTNEMLSQMSMFAVVPGSGIEYEVVYTIDELLSVAGNGVNPNDIITGGAAAVGGGGLSGVAATIGGLTAGQVVLFAALVGTGIVLLTEPELVETTLNDIYTYLDHTTQVALDETYFQETWIIDEEIIEAINQSLTKVVTISDGVVWSDSLVVSPNDLTGYTDTFSEKAIVVEVQPADDLTVEYFQLPRDTWVTVDKNQSILYKMGPAGKWNTDGTKRATTTSSSGGYEAELTILNNNTGVSVTTYVLDTDKTFFSYGSASRFTWYMAEPVYVDDGVKSGIEIVTSVKDSRETYYTFTGMTSLSDRYNSSNYPIIMQNTGTILDNKLITNVSYNTDTGRFVYEYKEQGQDESVKKKTVELPMEPFKWVYSPSKPSTNTGTTGALNTGTDTKPTIDDMGKIEYKPGKVEVPQINQEKIEIPKPDTETRTEVDPNTGEEKEVETNDVTDVKPDTDSSGDIGSGLGNKVDTDNPDKEQFKDFIKRPFSITGLFDWLPVPHTNLFDNATAIVGSIVLALFIFKVITAFF